MIKYCIAFNTEHYSNWAFSFLFTVIYGSGLSFSHILSFTNAMACGSKSYYADIY